MFNVRCGDIEQKTNTVAFDLQETRNELSFIGRIWLTEIVFSHQMRLAEQKRQTRDITKKEGKGSESRVTQEEITSFWRLY